MLETENVVCVVGFLSVVSLEETMEELNVVVVFDDVDFTVEIVWVEITVDVVDVDGVDGVEVFTEKVGEEDGKESSN